MQNEIYDKWKTTGSLLWIHGIRMCISFVTFAVAEGFSIWQLGQERLYFGICCRNYSSLFVLTLLASSTIIEDVRSLCQTGLASCAFYYCDFRDSAKQDVRGLLSSFILQLSDQSYHFSAILSYFYSSYDRGSRQPSNDALMECLKKMVGLPGQGVIYLIIDALDECPNVSGLPTPREQVFEVVQELIDLQLPHVHFCITSRLETDIRDVLEPLATHTVPLHEQVGQNQDIANFVRILVHNHRRMRRWREEDKQFVIETLTKRAGGM
jgi:hypothetical protein